MALTFPALLEPLSLQYIAASVQGHEVQILDMNVSDVSLEENLARIKPDLVGVPCHSTSDTYNALVTLKVVKACNPETITVTGGQHVTLDPGGFEQDFIDILVLGEGEITFRELVEAITQGFHLETVRGLAYRSGEQSRYTAPRELLEGLDQLPYPDRDGVKGVEDNYFYYFGKPCATLETSRGCPYTCSFCPSWKMNRKRYRTKSPVRIVRELVRIEPEYIFVVDDNFLEDTLRAKEICARIRAEGIRKRFSIQARSDTICKHPEMIEDWREAGLIEVFMGLEAADEKGLVKHQKRNSVEANERALSILKQNGIIAMGNFIVPSDFDESDFEMLLEYVNRINLDLPMYTILTPFPGTPLYEQSRDEIIIDDYEFYDLFHSVMETKLPREKFYEQFAKLYKFSKFRYQGAHAIDTEVTILKDLLRVLKRLRDPRSYLVGETYKSKNTPEVVECTDAGSNGL